jgi:dihydroorotase
VDNIVITRPDDWHVHLRDNEMLEHTVHAQEQHFARSLVMPNLEPPLVTVQSLLDYRAKILNYSKNINEFCPYMTLYLNESVSPNEITRARNSQYILGAKLYPAKSTTNSTHGAKSIEDLFEQFDALESSNLALQIHGEMASGDIFDREAEFIKKHLIKIIKNFPKLKIVLEHISTKAAVDFILQSSINVSATITPHHLLYNRNQLLANGIKPHYYCLPILKRESDQIALIKAAISGSNKFFAGTDSAPHPIENKESACGCAGVYSAPYALAMYTEAFDKANSLNMLNDFMSKFGADFYQLPILSQKIELIKNSQTIANVIQLGNTSVVPLGAQTKLQWSVFNA